MPETIAPSQITPQSSGATRESASLRGPETDAQPVPAPMGQKLPGILWRAKQDIRSLAPAEILTLQRTIGNQAVVRLVAGQSLQTKLTIGAPHDVYEKEADSVADQVMSRSSTLQGKRLQRLAAGGEAGLEAPSMVEDVLGTPGQPMAEVARQTLEPGFGQDFSHVRVHEGSQAAESAAAVNAFAYTVGNHIVFGEGQYAPGTNAGNRLLAHELTHVVQQGQVGRAVIQRDVGSDDYNRGYQDGLSGAESSAGPLDGDALTDYDEGYAKGHYEFSQKASAPPPADQQPASTPATQPSATPPEAAPVDTQAPVPASVTSNTTPTGASDCGLPGASVPERDQQYQENLRNARQTGNWQCAAEKLNIFDHEDVQSRLAQLSTQEVGSLHQGAIDNPRVGSGSQLAQLTVPGTPPASTAPPSASAAPAGPSVAPPTAAAEPAQAAPPVVASIANAPFSLYVDLFSECDYDVNYKVVNSFSTILQVKYPDGTEFELDIEQDFAEQSMTSEAARDAMAQGHIGKGGRIFPVVLAPRTVPRLWAAREEALRIQNEAFRDFAQLAVTGVMFALEVPAMPAGIMDEVAIESTNATRRPLSRGGGGGGEAAKPVPGAQEGESPPRLPQQGTRQKPVFDWQLAPSDESGMGHLDYRHAPWSEVEDTSKFTQDAWNDLRGLTEEAAENGTLGTVKPDAAGNPQAGVVYEYRFGQQVGVGARGQKLFRMRVVVDANNHVTTVFPF